MADRIVELLKSNQELFDLYARKEEYGSSSLDQYGRFLAKNSRHGSVREPRVSRFLLENGFAPQYPEGRKFAVCLTHDTDLLKPESFAWLRLPKVSRRLLSKVSKKFETAWNYGRILEVEERYDAKSTFFFMALQRGDQDFNYSIDELQSEIGMISDRGWEIGLHGGHSAYVDLVQLSREKSRIEKVLGLNVVGYRNHYLKMKIPLTWRILRDAGFRYDSTLGYSETVGFRNGMAHPFKPFDLESGETVDILEIPLSVMDGTLYEYLGLDQPTAWTTSKEIIDQVENSRGVLTVLWHNTYMSGPKLELYERILGYCKDKGAWMTSGREVWKWWSSHDFLSQR